jgi:hypothetical protein
VRRGLLRFIMAASKVKVEEGSRIEAASQRLMSQNGDRARRRPSNHTPVHRRVTVPCVLFLRPGCRHIPLDI